MFLKVIFVNQTMRKFIVWYFEKEKFIFKKKQTKKNFIATFYGWGSICWKQGAKVYTWLSALYEVF